MRRWTILHWFFMYTRMLQLSVEHFYKKKILNWYWFHIMSPIRFFLLWMEYEVMYCGQIHFPPILNYGEAHMAFGNICSCSKKYCRLILNVFFWHLPIIIFLLAHNYPNTFHFLCVPSNATYMPCFFFTVICSSSKKGINLLFHVPILVYIVPNRNFLFAICSFVGLIFRQILTLTDLVTR